MCDPFIEDPQEEWAGHAATPLPRCREKFTDLRERQAKGLRLTDELQATNVGVRIETIPSRAPPRRREKSPALIEPERPDAEARAPRDLAYREGALAHPGPGASVCRVAHGHRFKALP